MVGRGPGALCGNLGYLELNKPVFRLGLSQGSPCSVCPAWTAKAEVGANWGVLFSLYKVNPSRTTRTEVDERQLVLELSMKMFW